MNTHMSLSHAHAWQLLLAACGHAFCSPCLGYHVSVRLEAGVWPLRCPACPQAIRDGDCWVLASCQQQLRRMKHVRCLGARLWSVA